MLLFQPPQEELTDAEIAEVLRQSIAAAGRLGRHADVFLAGICAASTWSTGSGRLASSYAAPHGGGFIGESGIGFGEATLL